jgi:hypothetical protein
MGEGNLLTVGAALIALIPATCRAQGPGYRDAWHHVHLEALRQTIWRELAGRPEADRQRVSVLLAGAPGDGAFAAEARALAHLHGVAADERFCLRAGLAAFVLPEVVDPTGDHPSCRDLHVSPTLPASVRHLEGAVVDVTVHDADGRQLSQQRLEGLTAAELAHGTRSAPVSCAELADGRYEVRLRVGFDGAPAAAADPDLRWTFHVRRGYQVAAQAAMAAARDACGKLAEPERTLLAGLSAQVARAYAGEAFAVRSEAPRELDLLVTALRNLGAGQPVLARLAGAVATQLPTGGQPLGCVLRITAGAEPGVATAARPLVVFASGSPSHGDHLPRPETPRVRAAGWMAAALERFGAGSDWNVAYLDSPGSGENYGSHLRSALTTLRQLWPPGDRPVVLVCERDAATVATLHLATLRPAVDGVVLLGTSALSHRVLDELAGVALRVEPVGAASPRALDHVLRRADELRAAGTWRGDFGRLTPDAAPAWCFGPVATADAVAAFVRGLVPQR